MDRLNQRLMFAKKSLSTLDEVLQMPVDKIIRDAAIQRFEYTYETVWKLAQLYLFSKEDLEINTPNQVFRTCFQAKLLDEAQTTQALLIIKDRNLTTHTYNEKLAEHLYKQLPIYYQLMKNIISKIEEKIHL